MIRGGSRPAVDNEDQDAIEADGESADDADDGNEVLEAEAVEDSRDGRGDEPGRPGLNLEVGYERALEHHAERDERGDGGEHADGIAEEEVGHAEAASQTADGIGRRGRAGGADNGNGEEEVESRRNQCARTDNTAEVAESVPAEEPLEIWDDGRAGERKEDNAVRNR